MSLVCIPALSLHSSLTSTTFTTRLSTVFLSVRPTTVPSVSDRPLSSPSSTVSSPRSSGLPFLRYVLLPSTRPANLTFEAHTHSLHSPLQDKRYLTPLVEEIEKEQAERAAWDTVAVKKGH